MPDVPPEALEPTAAGRRVVRALGATAYAGFVMQSAAAAEAVMDAIARSDGTRASVLEQLRTMRESDGIIGGFRFDRYGDMTPAKLTVLRIRMDKRPSETLRGGYRGAVLDRVLSVPTGLGD
jgi:ABC-type branched-subunit amino acid transport system substrate-binding protein